MISLFPPNDDIVAFLRACKENPDDDAPRLIFADYLEENGQAERAQLFRLQCELARQPVLTPVAKAMQSQIEVLLDRYAIEWVKPWRHVLRHQHRRFRRGLLDLSLHASAFADTFRQKGHGATHYPWVEQLTLRDFDVNNMDAACLALAKLDGLCRLRIMLTYMMGVRAAIQASFEMVWNSPVMNNVRELEIESENLLNGLLSCWIQSQPCQQLHTLRLTNIYFFKDEAGALLADPTVIPTLKHLYVKYCYASLATRDAIRRRFGDGLHGEILDESEMIPF